jgi:hypothetical protein
MNEYHKIQTIFKRDMENKGKTLLFGQWTMPEFEYLAENEWEFTEKVDGTNIRVMWDGFGFRFGGRTDRADIPAKLIESLLHLFPDVYTFQDVFGDGPACIYGEGYGSGIQKGGKYRDYQDFVVFDVKVRDFWLYPDDVQDVARNFGLQCVPVCGHGTLFDAIKRVQDGFDSSWGSFTAEGIVARPVVPLFSRNGQRIITKIKHRDFLGGAQ